MSNPRVSDTATLVRLLVEGQVEFIVVGMSAAVFLGVPATTLDLDIVHLRTPDNIERLLTLLAKIGAYYRHDLENRRLTPTTEALAGRAHQNLQTNDRRRRRKSLAARARSSDVDRGEDQSRTSQRQARTSLAAGDARRAWSSR